MGWREKESFLILRPEQKVGQKERETPSACGSIHGRGWDGVGGRRRRDFQFRGERGRRRKNWLWHFSNQFQGRGFGSKKFF